MDASASDRLRMFVVKDPGEVPFQLHFEKGPWRCRLVGWPNDSIDAGVPAGVKEVLVEGLAALGPLTFLGGKESPQGRTLSPGWRRLLMQPELVIVTTSDPGECQRLFDESAFPWDMRGQAVFLGSGARHLRYRDVMFVLQANGIELPLEKLSGVDALFLPGVDGDWAEAWTRSEQIGEALEAAWRTRASQRGGTFELTDSNGFASRLAQMPREVG